MKNFTILTLISLIVLIINSCSIEKRVHRNGYHISWNKNIVTSNNPSKIDASLVSETFAIPKTEAESSHLSMETGTAASDPIIIDKKEVTYSNKSRQKEEFSLATIAEDKQIACEIPRINKIANQLDGPILQSIDQRVSNWVGKNNTSSSSGALKGLGWVVLIIGFLILLLASIGIGALLMLLGLVFVIAGGGSASAPKEVQTKQENITYIDVVYLKNGSIIKGMIMEQIPEKTIKIKTTDGSIFVYKMIDVLKITKEPAK
jgi:hypothetical protein